jgi:hypothetical protein
VIQEMERRLPASPFQDEWNALRAAGGGRRFHQRYVELGLLERVVPMVFAGIFIAILIWSPS